MKFKNKKGYLGKRISILPWQMAEQLAVEVDVKNVMEHIQTDRHTDKLIYLVRMFGKFKQSSVHTDLK